MADTPDKPTLTDGVSSIPQPRHHPPAYEVRDNKNHFFAAKWELPPHRRRTGCQVDHILVYWMAKTRIVRVAGGNTQRREAHPGSITFIPGGEYAQYLFEDNSVFVETHLSPTLVREFSERTLKGVPSIRPFRVDDDPWLSVYFQMLQAEMDLYRNAKPPVDSLLFGQAQQLLLAHLTRRYFNAGAAEHEGRTESRRSCALRPHLLKRVTDYIHQNLGADLRLADLAALAHLSETHFLRAFQAATGRPPYQYVINKRLEACAELLRADDALSIAEVAARMGFKSPSHFTAKFRTRYGVTPRDYRLISRN
ncbi:MAG: helix-turn-helix transcriptional regulator [Sulfurifustaceae bacterium]